MRPNALSLSLALCLALPAAASFAEISAAEPVAPDGATSADSGGIVHEPDREVVVATRAARALTDVPNTIDVIERKTMDERLVRDLKDLFRYGPGISVSDAFSIVSLSSANPDAVGLDSDWNGPFGGATVAAEYGDDRRTRARVALAHELDALNAGFACTRPGRSFAASVSIDG